MKWLLVLLMGCTTQFDRARIPCRDMPDCLPGVSCCDSVEIAGGTFDRGYDRSENVDGSVEAEMFHARGEAPATLGSFEMDRFEVTVGRFRRFLDDYTQWRSDGHPMAGEGADPDIGSASGWTASDAAFLPSRDELEADLGCGNDAATRGADTFLNGDDRLPINCVSWHVAFAFCLWEGKRLPTEAEWNFVAAGGDEQRAFPWSEPPDAVVATSEHMVSSALDDPPKPVGSRAERDGGRFGVHDLAGNVREWTLDLEPRNLSDYLAPCVDCVDRSTGPGHIRRGGDWGADFSRGRSAWRGTSTLDHVSAYTGIRCVR